jgi:hypothetical protein
MYTRDSAQEELNFHTVDVEKQIDLKQDGMDKKTSRWKGGFKGTVSSD